MSFNSLHFLWFFAAVWACYWTLVRRTGAQNAFLLAASYFFYSYWDWRFSGLLLASTVVDFACGLFMASVRATPETRRVALGLSIALNLGALAFFKYMGFFVNSANVLFVKMGIPVSPMELQIILLDCPQIQYHLL